MSTVAPSSALSWNDVLLAARLAHLGLVILWSIVVLAVFTRGFASQTVWRAPSHECHPAEAPGEKGEPLNPQSLREALGEPEDVTPVMQFDAEGGYLLLDFDLPPCAEVHVRP